MSWLRATSTKSCFGFNWSGNCKLDALFLVLVFLWVLVSPAWDFTDETASGSEDIWRLCEDLMSYPILAWQKWPLGDFFCPDGSDFKDYAALAGQWQQAPGEPSADIAPEIHDEIVNGLDLKVLCENWLAGVE